MTDQQFQPQNRSDTVYKSVLRWKYFAEQVRLYLDTYGFLNSLATSHNTDNSDIYNSARFKDATVCVCVCVCVYTIN